MPLTVVIALSCMVVVFLAPALAYLLRPVFARAEPAPLKIQPWKVFSKRIVKTK